MNSLYPELLTCQAIQYIHGLRPRIPTLHNPVSMSRAPRLQRILLPTILPLSNRSQAVQQCVEPSVQCALPALAAKKPIS